MPKGGVIGGSRSAEEIEAEIEERVMARVLAAKNGRRELAALHAARDAGMSSTAFPLLTSSNYHNWSLLMRVILEGRCWWKAVEMGDAEFTDDRLALEQSFVPCRRRCSPPLPSRKPPRKLGTH
jgi:hypothetical protein